jgi:hypothetical protein
MTLRIHQSNTTILCGWEVCELGHIERLIQCPRVRLVTAPPSPLTKVSVGMCGVDIGVFRTCSQVNTLPEVFRLGT